MIKAILFLMCSISLAAQELKWTPVTEPMPGANMKRVLSISENLVVAFSEKSGFVLTDTSNAWEERRRPDVEIIGHPEVNYAEFCFVKNKNGDVIIWACANKNATRLYYSVDTCRNWMLKELPKPVRYGASITIFGGIDENLYLFEENEISHVYETIIYKTADTVRTVEFVAAFQGVVLAGDVVQTLDSSLVVINSSNVGMCVARYKGGEWSGVAGLESQRSSAIAIHDNTIYIAAGKNVYQLEGWKKIVRSYRIDYTYPSSMPFREVREVLQCSKSGDAFLMYAFDSGIAFAYQKKNSNASFQRLNNVPYSRYQDVGLFGMQWLLLDHRGVWAVNKENKMVWSSNGVYQHAMKRFAISQNGTSVVASSEKGGLYYKSLQENTPWQHVTSGIGNSGGAIVSDVVAVSNKNMALIQNGVPFSSNNGGLDWKASIFTDTVNVNSAENMLSESNVVFITMNNKVYKSIDAGASYQEYLTSLPTGFIDYTMYDDSTLLFVTDNNIISYSPYSGYSNEQKRNRFGAKILTNKAGSIGLVRYNSTGNFEVIGVSRRAKNEAWQDVDTTITNFGEYGNYDIVTGASIANDNTVYISTQQRIYRLLPNDSILRLVYRGYYNEHLGPTKLNGNILYSARSRGGLLKYILPTSTTVAGVSPQNRTLNVYPLPAKNTVTVAGLLPGTSLRVVDSSGRVLLEQTIVEETMQLDLGNFPVGMYSVQTDGATAMIVVAK